MIVIDTGVLYALADTSDINHDSCTRWLESAQEPLLVPSLVITEAAYLIGSRGGAAAEALFLDALGPAGRFRIGELQPEWTAPAFVET